MGGPKARPPGGSPTPPLSNSPPSRLFVALVPRQNAVPAPDGEYSSVVGHRVAVDEQVGPVDVLDGRSLALVLSVADDVDGVSALEGVVVRVDRCGVSGAVR